MNEMNEEEMKEVETVTRFLLRKGDRNYLGYHSLDHRSSRINLRDSFCSKS